MIDRIDRTDLGLPHDPNDEPSEEWDEEVLDDLDEEEQEEPVVSPKGLEGSGTANLTNALGGFGKVIDDMFGSEKRVYPLALYKTL